MKNWRFFFMLLLLFLANRPEVFAQFKVSGTVSDGSETLAGVTVLEKGDSVGIRTDINGQFSYTCTTENPTLIFSFVSYEVKEIRITSDTVLNVILEPWVRYCLLGKETIIGLSSGLNYNNLGLFFRKRYFGNVDIATEAEWRFLSKNNYLNLNVTSPFFRINYRWFTFRASYRNRFFHQTDDRIEQPAGSLQFNALRTTFSIGYSHNFRRTGEERQQNAGLLLGAEHWFGNLHLKTEGVIWSDKSVQYRIALRRDISHSRLGISLSHEQIFAYREWGIALFYTIY